MTMILKVSSLLIFQAVRKRVSSLDENQFCNEQTTADLSMFLPNSFY